MKPPQMYAAVDVHYPPTGIAPAEAAELVRTMTGKFRLPDALRRADALACGHLTAIQELRS
jgi:endonuclease V-like protein UPF0215 family